MIKTTLAALIAVAAVSTPAFASMIIIEEPSNAPYYSETDVLDRLQQRGIDATSIENWGQLIRAYVRQADGTEAQLFFKRDSLVQVML